MQSLQPSQVSSRSYLEIKQRQHGMSQFLQQNNNNNNNLNKNNNNSNLNSTIQGNSNARSSSLAGGDRKGSMSQKAFNISQKAPSIQPQDQSFNQLQSFNSCTDNKENVSFQANSHQSGHSRTFNYETSFQSNSLYESLKPNRQNNTISNINMKKSLLSMDGSQAFYDQETKDNNEQFNSNSLQGYYQAGNIENQQIYPSMDTKAIRTTKTDNIYKQRKNNNQQNSQLTNPSCISTNNNSIFTHKNSLQNTSNSHSNSIIAHNEKNRSISQLKQQKYQNFNHIEQMQFHNTTGIIHPKNENTQNHSQGNAQTINQRSQNSRKPSQTHNSQPLLSSLINEDSMHAENMIENYLERVFSCSIQSGEKDESLILSGHKQQEEDQGINRLLFSQVESEVHHPFRSLREPSVDELDNDRPLPQIIFESIKGLSSPMADLKNEDKEQQNNNEYFSDLKKQIIKVESQRNESLKLYHQALKSKGEVEEQLRQTQMKLEEVSSNETKVIVELNQAIQEKQSAIKEKELANEEKNNILEKKVEIENGMLILERRIEQAEKDKETALNDKNQAVQNENIAVEQMNKLVQEKDKVVLEKNECMEKLERIMIQLAQVIKEKEDVITEKNIAIQDKDSSSRQLIKEIEAKQELIILNQQCETKINGQVHQLEQLYLRNGQLEQQACEYREKHEHEVKELQQQQIVLESQVNQFKQLNSQLQSLSEVATSQARLLATHNQQLQGQLNIAKQNNLRDNNLKDINLSTCQITLSYKQAFTEVITNALTALDLISQKIQNYQVSVKSSVSSKQNGQDTSQLSEQLMEQVFMGIQHISQCFLQFTTLSEGSTEISPSFQQIDLEEHFGDLDNVQTAQFGRDQEVKKKHFNQQQSQYQHDQMMRMQWASERNNNYQHNYAKEGNKTNHI